MFLLETVAPEKAEGKVAQAYGIFPKEFGVPTPLQLMSASPELLSRQSEVIKYYMGHPRLTFPTLTAIRYLAAGRAGHPFCAELNGGLLMRIGMTPDDLTKLANDPASCNLEPKEAAMVKFVAKALDNPASVTKADIETLHKHGYVDSDAFDALAHAANMTAGALMWKTFVRE